MIPQAAFKFICNHCCPSPALFTEPNRLTLNKLESESESESESKILKRAVSEPFGSIGNLRTGHQEKLYPSRGIVYTAQASNSFTCRYQKDIKNTLWGRSGWSCSTCVTRNACREHCGRTTQKWLLFDKSTRNLARSLSLIEKINKWRLFMSSATCYGAPAGKFARLLAESPSPGMGHSVLPETWWSNPHMAEGKTFSALSRAGGRTELWVIFLVLAVVILLISGLGTLLLLVLSDGTPRTANRAKRKEEPRSIQTDSSVMMRRRGALSVHEELDLLEEWMCGSIQQVSVFVRQICLPMHGIDCLYIFFCAFGSSATATCNIIEKFQRFSTASDTNLLLNRVRALFHLFFKSQWY